MSASDQLTAIVDPAARIRGRTSVAENEDPEINMTPDEFAEWLFSTGAYVMAADGSLILIEDGINV